MWNFRLPETHSFVQTGPQMPDTDVLNQCSQVRQFEHTEASFRPKSALRNHQAPSSELSNRLFPLFQAPTHQATRERGLLATVRGVRPSLCPMKDRGRNSLWTSLA